jgi:hypothetical protein
MNMNHRHKINAHWSGLPVLLWLSSYVASHQLAIVPQTGARYQFYCAFYYLTLNSNCGPLRESKNLKKNICGRQNSKTKNNA